ncbi:MAG: NADH-quinone oxidoreductase subunit J [Methanosarcinales archaeon]|jgi:NADH:ubiquinone oxidoreductase subunit 6 (subunit J)|nr:NADH-quinone oxidoreductase subunit J [Methanosarcinales archaeon]MCD4808819.1 NADH-quinone oxidoreductase subunit J [Methanosarcinales archaeon]
MIDLQIIPFAIISIIMIGSSIMVVKSKEVVHSAFHCVIAMIGAAGLYVLLNAQFIAVVQLLVYVGAIGVMILFAVMLTMRNQEVE